MGPSVLHGFLGTKSGTSQTAVWLYSGIMELTICSSVWKWIFLQMQNCFFPPPQEVRDFLSGYFSCTVKYNAINRVLCIHIITQPKNSRFPLCCHHKPLSSLSNKEIMSKISHPVIINYHSFKKIFTVKCSFKWNAAAEGLPNATAKCSHPLPPCEDETVGDMLPHLGTGLATAALLKS